MYIQTAYIFYASDAQKKKNDLWYQEKITLTNWEWNHYVCFDMYTDKIVEKEINPR